MYTIEKKTSGASLFFVIITIIKDGKKYLINTLTRSTFSRCHKATATLTRNKTNMKIEITKNEAGQYVINSNYRGGTTADLESAMKFIAEMMAEL